MCARLELGVAEVPETDEGPELGKDVEEGNDERIPGGDCPIVAAAGVNDGDVRVLKKGCRSRRVDILDIFSSSSPGRCSSILFFPLPGLSAISFAILAI